MEHELRAECDACVVQIAVREGEQLDAGQLLLLLGPPGATPRRRAPRADPRGAACAGRARRSRGAAPSARR